MTGHSADLRGMGRAVSNRGRWGPEDQRGTINLITDGRIAAAARLVLFGEVISLAVPLDEAGPQDLPGRMDPKLLMSATGVGQDYPVLFCAPPLNNRGAVGSPLSPRINR